MRRLLLVTLMLSVTGCSALKERTGEYVTESVVDHIAEKVDQRLERRGLSISQIKGVTDLNDDGVVDMAEVRETAKLAGREVALSEAERWKRESQEELKAATKQFVTADDQSTVKSKLQDFWNYLLATIGALVATVVSYLTKQVFSAKSDGRRDAEIAKAAARTDALERLLGRDLNNDGRIGSDRDQSPTPEALA